MTPVALSFQTNSYLLYARSRSRMFANRVSGESNAIGRVRLFVLYLLKFEPTNFRP